MKFLRVWCAIWIALLAFFMLEFVLGFESLESYKDRVRIELAIARIDSTIRVLRSDVRFMEDRVSGVQDTLLMHEAEIRSLMRRKP